jgi:hypothetical protein
MASTSAATKSCSPWGSPTSRPASANRSPSAQAVHERIVNDQSGGRSQLSGLISTAAITLVLLFLTEPIRYLPIATSAR